MKTASKALFLSAVQDASYKSRAEFSDIVGSAAVALVSNHPRPVWRSIMREVVANSFQELDLMNSMFCPKLEEVVEGAEYPAGSHLDGVLFVEKATVKTYGKILPIAREAVINDRTLRFLADMPGAVIAAAYRREGDAVYAALANNANLADGSPWFNASNSVSTASIPTAIEAGLEALRGQAYPDGQAAYLEPYAFVLPVSWNISASDSPLEFSNKPPIIIHSSAVSDGYIFADPQYSPTLALVTLRSGSDPEIMSSTTGPRHLGDLHAVMKVRHEFAVVPLSRTGVVKMSTAQA